MKRPRLSLGLESSRATLNGPVCERIGRQLAAERSTRQLTVHDVAERLLLSPRQVQGMEASDWEAFYSAEFYVTALRKYHALLDLQPALIDQVLLAAGSAPTAQAAPVPLKPVSGIRRARAPWLAGAAVLAVVVMGGWLVSLGLGGDRAGVASRSAATPVPTLQHLVSHQLPRPTSPVSLVAPGPATGPASRGDAVTDEGFGHISVARTTWVFVRYQDNSTVERILSPGDRFVLRGVPVYLAAGEAPGAEVVIVGQPIDPGPFNVNGQLRIGSAFLTSALRR